MYTIRLHVETEKDLFNPLDPDKNLLCEDVKFYLLDRIQNRSFREDIELHIIAEEPIDTDRLNNALHGWASEELNRIKATRRRNLIMQLWMFCIGAAFITASLLLKPKINTLVFTILSTIGSFAIWEASSIWIVQNPKLNHRKRIIDKINTNMQIKTEILK